MSFEFSSETGKIPTGYGYVLKPSSVSDALLAAGVEINAHLIRSHGRHLFDANFWPPNPNVAYERLYMTAGTAIGKDLPDLRRRVEQEALPKLISWISAILASDPHSPIRREKQSIALLSLRR